MADVSPENAIGEDRKEVETRTTTSLLSDARALHDFAEVRVQSVADLKREVEALLQQSLPR
jgi:hypothetical protein